MATDLGHWEAGRQLTDIYVDGDACPVREEIYRAAARLRRNVLVVPNGSRPIRPPGTSNVRMVLVGDTADGADDWIVEHISAVDVCVTSDIPLGSCCLKKGRASSPLLANMGRRRISVTYALAGRPSRFCSSSGSKAVSVAFYVTDHAETRIWHRHASSTPKRARPSRSPSPCWVRRDLHRNALATR